MPSKRGLGALLIISLTFVSFVARGQSSGDDLLSQSGTHAYVTPGGPSTFGAGIRLGSFQSPYSTTAVTIPGTIAPLTFGATFDFAQAVWGGECDTLPNEANVPLPLSQFGKVHPNCGNGRVAWTSSLYSFVEEWLGGIRVHLASGEVIQFNSCEIDGTAHFCNPVLYSEIHARLFVHAKPDGSPEFVLYQPGVGRLYFDQFVTEPGVNGYAVYFLSRMEGLAYAPGGPGVARNLFSVAYTDGGLTCQSDGTTVYSQDAGIPYPEALTSADGTTLKFHYKQAIGEWSVPLSECVLDRVALMNPADGAEVPVATYQYLDGGAGELAGQIASITSHPSETIERYTYDWAQDKFRVERVDDAGTVMVIERTFDPGGSITSDVTPEKSYYLANAATATHFDSCDAGSSVPDTECAWQTFTTNDTTCGDGTGVLGGYSERFMLSRKADGGGSTAITRATANDYAPSCMGVSTSHDLFYEFWTDAGTRFSQTVYDKSGKRKSYEVVESAPMSDGLSGSVRYPEWRSTTTGIAPADSKESYSYVYHDGGVTPEFREQLLKTTTRASVLTDGGVAVETRHYDRVTNRLLSVDQSGYTQVFASGAWTIAPIKIGTFYLDAHSNGQAAGFAPEPDPLGRTLEVQGPCVLDASGACSEVNPPITRYFYYPSNAGLNANRLAKVVSLACSGPSTCTELTTEYLLYDLWGNVTKTKDANGEISTDTYQGARHISHTSAKGMVTTYSYDDVTGKLNGTHFPDGHWELLSYRTASGVPTPLLQWKEEVGGVDAPPDGGVDAPPDGNVYSERVEYLYHQNGALKQELYRDGDGTVRRVARYEPRPDGAVTYRQVGVSLTSGGYAQTGQFNPLGARTALSVPYLRDPTDYLPFCDVTPDGLPEATVGCSGISYDALGRLDSLRQPALASGVSPTVGVSYDVQGNVRAISTSQAGSGATYQYDDFHNLVEVTAGWMSKNLTDSSAGTVRYGYNALGSITVKQTPQMAAENDWIEYTYDSSGRELEAKSMVTGDPLYSIGYGNVPGGSGCSSFGGDHAIGRVRWRKDALGTNWYSYDIEGHLVAIRRERSGTTGCSLDAASAGAANDVAPTSTFTYDDKGRLTAQVYPHGRAVRYEYGDGGYEGRVVKIEVTLGGVQVPVASNIRYEPFGGVASYNVGLADGGAGPLVEYLQGDNGYSLPSATCASPRPAEGVGGDQTGRLRGLWVSSPGTSSGDIFKREYTYRADQIVAEDTCVLSNSSSAKAHRVFYSSDGVTPDGYDSSLRLSRVSRPNPGTAAGEFGSRGGTVGRREFSYDYVGNRTAETDDCWKFNESYVAGKPDRLARRDSVAGYNCPASPFMSSAYGYDLDGRVTSVVYGPDVQDSSGSSPHSLEFDTGFYPDGGGIAGVDYPADSLDGVYREVIVDGVSDYQYFYDSFGRRIRKLYPLAGSATESLWDDYFYNHSQMVEDRGFRTEVDGGVAYPIDEYVWLGGRPIAVIKSEFHESGSAWARTDVDCGRNGEGSIPCGLYSIVTDGIGKPVLMLDGSGRVTGAAEYTPFGLPNRVTYVGDTHHPSSNSDSGKVLAFFRQKAFGGESIRLRARYAMLDTVAGSKVYLSDGGGSPLAGGEDFGGHSLERHGDWVDVPADGLVHLRYEGAGSSQYQGVTLSGYDYQRFQPGATPVWTRLGFPGQYYDPETDLFENWHRFYDPTTGRYLEPEPMWRTPGAIVGALAAGRFTPAYAYAANNPINVVDPTGLKTTDVTGQNPATFCDADGTCYPVLTYEVTDDGDGADTDEDILFDQLWRFRSGSPVHSLPFELTDVLGLPMPRPNELSGWFDDIPGPSEWDSNGHLACVAACIAATDPLNSLPGVTSMNGAGDALRGGLLLGSNWPKSFTPWGARAGAKSITSVMRLLNIASGRNMSPQFVKGFGRVGAVSTGYGLTMAGAETACAASCM